VCVVCGAVVERSEAGELPREGGGEERRRQEEEERWRGGRQRQEKMDKSTATEVQRTMSMR